MCIVKKVFALALLLPVLASCRPGTDSGISPAGTDTSAAEVNLRPVETISINNGFQGEFHKFPTDYKPYGRAEILCANGLFYVKGSLWEPEKERAYYIVSPAEGFAGYRKIPAEETTLGKNERDSVMSYSISENGLATLHNVYAVDPATSKTASIARAYLHHYDSDGNLLRSTDIKSVFSVTDNPLTGATDELEPLMSLQNFFYGANGTVYLVNEYSVAAVDENGEKLYETEAGYYIFDSMITPDGRVLVQYSDIRIERKKYWAYMDDEAKGFSEPLEIPETELKDPALVMGGGHDFYFNARDGLYYIDEGGTEPMLLCSWEESGVSYNSIKALVIPDENTVFVFSQYDFNGHRGEPEYAVLTRPAADADSLRQIITLGEDDTHIDFTHYAAQFNRQSDKYYIVIRDYQKLADLGERSALLQEDILGGNAPDIVYFSYRATDNLAEKGAMADLTPYLEANPEFKADLFAASYEPFAIGGKLYHITSGLMIRGMSGKAKNLPAPEEWTPEAFLALAQSLDADPDAQLVSRTRSEMKTALISNNLTAYVNFADNSCSFDSPRFIQILQYLKTLPEKSTDVQGDTAILGVYDARVALRQDRVWIDTISQIGSFWNLMRLRGQFGGEELVYLGMPSDEGGIPSLNAACTFSVTADSPVKEGAWEFIRYVLSEEMLHYGSPVAYLPVTKSNFLKQAETEKKFYYFSPLDGTPGIYQSWDGETVPEYDPARQVGLAITEEDVQFVLDLLENRTLYPLDSTSYNTINALINEETAAFFTGSVTAEDTARRIQSRVSLYLAEQAG